MNRALVWFFSILVPGLAVGIILLFHLGSASTEHLKGNILNAYSKDATFVSFDKKGIMINNLQASKIRHYTQDNTTYFDNPKLLTYTNNRTPWHISALHAQSTKGSDTIYLSGKVKLHRPQHGSSPTMTITTSKLTYFSKKSIAVTKSPVTIVRPGSVTKGIGAHANLKKNVFTLLANMHGDYAPESKKK